MDRIFEFIGNFLMQTCENDGNLGWALFIFTVIMTVFMLFSIYSEIRSLQLADQIRPFHEGILRKYQNNPDKMAKELLGMNRGFGYNTFLGISGNLIHVFIVFLLAGTFFQAERFLPAFGAGERGLLWIRDLTVSPLQLILQGRYFPELIIAIISLLIMDFLISWNARLVISKSLMPVKTLYKCLTWLALAASFFLPQAILAYFSIHNLLKNITYVVVIRFFPYSLNKSQQAFYKECSRRIK